MSYYLLADTIQPCTKEELLTRTNHKYVAVLTTPEWARDRDCFDMGIELEPDVGDIHNTKAEVNYDSLTGTFQLPDRENIEKRDFRFAFALDEKGIVFIDDSGKAEQMIDAIRRRKRWRKPSLERFLYDFLALRISCRDRGEYCCCSFLSGSFQKEKVVVGCGCRDGLSGNPLRSVFLEEGCLMKMFTVKNLKKLSVAVCAAGILAGAFVLPGKAMAAEAKAPASITLSVPFTKDGLTVMEALDRRRSSRSFADAALQEKQLSALLWAADGINRPESGKRVHPTTRGIYNIDVYAVMANGIYKYDPEAHALNLVSPVDFRPQINAKQTFVHTAPLTLFFVSNPVPPRDPSHPVNPERQHANNCLVAGTMLQSVALVAASEGLGTCVRGSVDKAAFAKAAGLSKEQTVLISQTVGVLP